MSTNKTMSASAVVKLEYPIEHAGEPVRELTLRRPTVSDSLQAQRSGAQTPAELELQMLAQLSDLPVQALHQLDMQDYLKLQAALQALVRPPQ